MKKWSILIKITQFWSILINFGQFWSKSVSTSKTQNQAKPRQLLDNSGTSSERVPNPLKSDNFDQNLSPTCHQPGPQPMSFQNTQITENTLNLTHFGHIFWTPIFQNPPSRPTKSQNPEFPGFSLKIVSKSGIFHPQKSWKITPRHQNPKILNHVFKSSRKTLSPSRTYCKNYKIENIGKIGQLQRNRGWVSWRSGWFTMAVPGQLWVPPLEILTPLSFQGFCPKTARTPNYHF